MDLVREITRSTQVWDFGLICSFDNGDPVGSIRFFETEMLPNLKVRRNLTLVLNRSAHQEITSRSHDARYAGVHYNLEAVDMRHGGVFHPKLYLFTSDGAVRILMGSCNLTRSGIKRNVESVIRLDLDDNDIDGPFGPVIGDVSTFLTRAFLSENELVFPVSQSLRDAIQGMLKCEIFAAPQLASQTDSSSRDAFFLSSVDTSIWSQVLSIVGEEIEEIEVLSPFYDQELVCFEEISNLDCHVKFYVPEERNTFPSEAFNEELSLWDRFRFFGLKSMEGGISRFIHAKMVRISTSTDDWTLIASSNFTRAGMFAGGSRGSSHIPVCNLEIGMLLRNADLSSLEFQSAFQTRPIDRPSDLMGGWDQESFLAGDAANLQDQPEDWLSTGFYDGESILLECSDVNRLLSRDFRLELFLDQSHTESHKPSEKDGPLRFTPRMAIDQGVSIRVRLSIRDDPRVFPLIIVNRSSHAPSNLPSLSAGAFGRCLDLGGDAGLDEAFRLARESGREDWLHYLLTHWPLDRILLGREAQEDDPDSSDIVIPSLREPKQSSFDIAGLRANVRATFGEKRLWENLVAFVNEVDADLELATRRIVRYGKYCLPIFVEIASQYCQILRTQEARKRENPRIQFPEYTWLQNYKTYEPRVAFMFGAIFSLLPVDGYARQGVGTDNAVRLMAYLWVFLQLHTEETLSKLVARRNDFQRNLRKARREIRDEAERIFCQSDADGSRVFEDILAQYRIPIEFKYEFSI